MLVPDDEERDPRLAGVTTVLDPRYPIVGVSLDGGLGVGPPTVVLDARTFPVTEFGMVTSFGAWKPGRRYTAVPVGLRPLAPPPRLSLISALIFDLVS